ncbi:MAG: hypothetical protein ACRDEA_03780 [Microcystaceae cyanobacterium]
MNNATSVAILFTKFVPSLIRELAGSLPLSLLMKFGDGHLSPDELKQLASEVANSAMKVLVTVYNDHNDQSIPIPKVKIDAKS